jgi:hypothetical protein
MVNIQLAPQVSKATFVRVEFSNWFLNLSFLGLIVFNSDLAFVFDTW